MLTLTKEELHNLTGLKTRDKQAEWLSSNGLPFRRDDRGRVLVLSSIAEGWAQGATNQRASAGPRMDLVS